MSRNVSIKCLSTFMAMISFFFLWGFTSYNENSGTYIVSCLARWNENLFPSLLTLEGTRNAITPQFFCEALLRFFTIFTGRIEVSMAVAHVFFCAVLCVGVVYFIYKHCEHYRLLVTAFFLACLYFLNLSYASNSLWRQTFLYANAGISLTFICFALTWDDQKKWVAAFLINGLSACFHIQVAAACFVSMFVLLCVDAFMTRTPRKLLDMIPGFLVFMGVAFLMMNALPSSMANRDFIELYANFRLAHHVLPKVFNSTDQLYKVAIIAQGIVLLYYALAQMFEDKLKQRLMILMTKTIFLCVLSVSAIAVNYVFVEIWPLALVAKIQPARFINIFSVWLILSLTYLFLLLLKKRLFAQSAFIFSSVICGGLSHIGLMLSICAASILLAKHLRCSKMHNYVYLLKVLNAALWTSSVLWMAFKISYQSSSQVRSIVLFTAFLICASILTERLNGRKLWQGVIGLLLFIATAGLLAQKYCPNGKPIPFDRAFKYIMVDPELHELALNFREKTSFEENYYANPFKDNLNFFFSLYSERTSIISYKAMPFTDIGLVKWQKRLTEIGAIQKIPGSYRRITNFETDFVNTIRFALKYDAQYILCLAAELDNYTRSGYAEPWLWSKNKRYVILKINEDSFLEDERKPFTVSFTSDNTSGPVMELSGFHKREKWGAWTNAKDNQTAVIELFRPVSGPFRLILTMHSMIPQTVKVIINGQARTVEVVRGNSDYVLDYELSESINPQIQIVSSNPRSPKSLGINNDQRILGVGVIRMVFKMLENE